MDDTNKQAIGIALVLSLVITAVALYFYFSDPTNKIGRQTAVVKESDTDDTEEETDDKNDDAIESTSEGTTGFIKPTEGTSTPAKNGWMSYTSSQGISFDYPEKVSGTDCSGKTGVAVPLKAFEDSGNDSIYLTADCSDTLESLRKDTLGVSAAKDGYKQEKVAGEWNIVLAPIKNEDDLDAFIGKHYGTGGCEAGERQLIKGQDDIYIVTIDGKDWANPGDRISISKTCKVDYAYKILYAPKKGKAVSVILGQGCTFKSVDDQEDCYEMEDKIIASMTFD